jgi:hypothetical protein
MIWRCLQGPSTAITSPPLGSSRLDLGERPFQQLPSPCSLLIGRCLRQGTGQRVQDAQRRERPEIVEIVGRPPEQGPQPTVRHRYTELAWQLKGYGLGEREKKTSITAKLNRGTFTTTFFLEMMKLIGRETVDLAGI